LLSAATVKQTRDSGGRDDFRIGSVASDNRFRFLDFRQDWTWAASDTQMPRWGINFGDQQGDYDYALYSRNFDPLVSPVPTETAYATDMDVGLRKAGVYGAWRTRFTPQLTAEVGVRWDTWRYDAGEDFDAVSPRLNLVYTFGDHELRAAWGEMYQAQAVNELQVEDNVTQFFEPEHVRQAVIGYTRHFAHGLSARVDVYDKDYRDQRARYENVLDPIQLIAEGADDRIRIDAPRAHARGVELTLRREAERGIAGWVSYAWARAEDLDGDHWVARAWQQERTLSFGGSWTGNEWNLSLAGLIHSGTPTTEIGIVTTPLANGGYAVDAYVGPRNAERLSPYARLDLRVNRDVMFANSKVSLYLEITNLLDRDNECCVEDYELEPRLNAPPVLDAKRGYWLPLLPSFGFQWEF
jgi:outer membrane receptor protein involved in Fe transport